MREPSYEYLEQMRREGELYIGFASRLSGSPQIYKYFWWVFHAGSPAEGVEFLHNWEYALPTHEAIQLMDALKEKQEPCMVYNDKIYRRDSPFTRFIDLEKRSNYAWAPPWEEDPDPEIHGHK